MVRSRWGRFYNQAGQNYIALDDRGLRKLYMAADRAGLQVPKDYFTDVVLNMARENGRHPVREYFDGLTWDGNPRLDRWLERYAKADDSDYTCAVGRNVLIAAVRRVMQPGAKFDQLMVLEGEQGAGKSSLIQVLAGSEWFSDCVRIGDDPKVIVEQTQGRLIVEISELSGIGRRDIESIKSMLSRRTDSARLAYDSATSTVPRQFILIGTTNDSTYLQDPTGNRRFWPVRVGSVDLEALERDRDQLWAEAVHYEATGESLELPERLWRVAAEIQGQRKIEEPQEERLKEVVGERTGAIRTDELYAAIGLGHDRVAQRKPYHNKLIERVM